MENNVVGFKKKDGLIKTAIAQQIESLDINMTVLVTAFLLILAIILIIVSVGTRKTEEVKRDVMVSCLQSGNLPAECSIAASNAIRN